MLALPPVLPEISHRFSTRLGRDHYVRFDTCGYSVHPEAIGRLIEVRADLDFVVVTCAGEEGRPPTDEVWPRTGRSPRSTTPAPDARCDLARSMRTRRWSTSTSNSATSPFTTRRWGSHRWRRRQERASPICAGS
jgi:hypothetical protein